MENTFALLQELKKLNESISRIAQYLTPPDPLEHFQRLEKRIEQLGNALKQPQPQAPAPVPKKLFTVGQASEETGVSAYTIREGCREARIPCDKWGKAYRLRAEVVEGIKEMGLPPVKAKAG